MKEKNSPKIWNFVSIDLVMALFCYLDVNGWVVILWMDRGAGGIR